VSKKNEVEKTKPICSDCVLRTACGFPSSRE
jgi:hypothetical protein